jgi:hypothetical protein
MFFWIASNYLQAQEVVAASGGNATGTGGFVSYTVGQVAYTTSTNTSGTVTQGVQQPYEIYVVTEIEDATGVSLEIVIYPNPASDFLKLLVEDGKLENLSYQIYDINGDLLQIGDLVGKETVIQMRKLLPAAYYLKISDNQEEIKTFKIIKN